MSGDISLWMFPVLCLSQIESVEFSHACLKLTFVNRALCLLFSLVDHVLREHTAKLLTLDLSPTGSLGWGGGLNPLLSYNKGYGNFIFHITCIIHILPTLTLYTTYHACPRIGVPQPLTFYIACFIKVRKQEEEQNSMETNPDHKTFRIITVWVKQYLELMCKYQHKLHLQIHTQF